MKVLVTGGLGFVGSHLVRRLEERGHDVYVCDQSHHHGENYVRADVASFRQVQRIFDKQDFDLVYHLAAEFGRWNGEDYYDTLWQTNAIGTKNLIRMQEQLGFKMVFFSSSEVYGDFDGVMSEDVMDSIEIKQLNDYAMTKWVGEMQVRNSAAMAGTESVRVRLFNTYGAGERYSPYRSVNIIFAYRAVMRLPYVVFLDHHRTSSYVSDTVETLSNIADNFKAGEVYNLASSEYHDIKTLSDLTLAAAGVDDKLVEYKEAEPFTTKNKKVDTSKAERDLNHAPKVSLEEGVERTVAWVRKHYSP